MRNEITEGSLIKAMVAIALPTVLSSLLQGMYNVVDMFWVGKLGAAAVAAVSLSFPFIFLMITLGMGLSIAGSIMVSHHKGAGRHERVNYVGSQTLASTFIISILLAAVGYVSAPYVLGLMGLEASVFADATSYLAITYAGLPFVFFYFAFQSLLRGSGNATPPLYVVAFSVFMNAVLDPIFIFGYGPVPAMGVPGAALATVITQAVAALIGVIMLLRGTGGMRVTIMRPHLDMLKKTVRLGAPASAELASISLGLMAMTFLVAPFGTEVIAAYGIAIRVLSFFVIPAAGLAMATTALVGQNMGAEKIERAEKATVLGILTGFAVMTVLGALTFAFSRAIASVFIADAYVIGITEGFLNVIALSFGFMAFQEVVRGTLKGAGHTMMSMAISLVLFWVIRFPLAYVLAYFTPLSYAGLWWSFPLSFFLAALLSVAIFRSGAWKKKKARGEFL